MFVIRLKDQKRPPYPFDLTDLLFAVEVESPNNPAYDHQTKRELYLSNGIPEYWVVNAECSYRSRAGAPGTRVCRARDGAPGVAARWHDGTAHD